MLIVSLSTQTSMAAMKLFLLALVLTGCQAFFGASHSEAGSSVKGSDVAPKTLTARQTEIPESTSCTKTSTAQHIAATCTPIVGVISTINCRRESTVNVTGCDVSRSTSFTTTSFTITATCDSAACPDSACGYSVTTAIGEFPDPTFTPTTSAVENRDIASRTPFHNITPLESDHLGDSHFPSQKTVVNRQTGDGDGGGYTTYEDSWIGEWSQVDPEVKHRQDAEDENEKTSVHSSSRVRAFEKEKFNMGVQGLVGCTSVIVVSRRGVWMSHFWETPTFTSQFADTWDNDVAVGMYQGDDSGEFPGLNEYSSIPDGLFIKHEEGDPRTDMAIVIVTPALPDGATNQNVLPQADPTSARWKYHWEITDIWNSLQATYGVQPQVALYDKSFSDKEQMRTTGLGKVIVSYHPTQPTGSDGGDSEMQCSVPYASVDIWIYGNPEPVGDVFHSFYADSWPAFDTQQLLVDGGQKLIRDDANVTEASVCPVSFDPTSSVSNTSISTAISTSFNSSATTTKSSTSSKATASSTSTTSSTSSSSSTLSASNTTTSSLTTPPPVTSCGYSTTTFPVSPFFPYYQTVSAATICVCNDNQRGSIFTQRAPEDAGSLIICNPDLQTSMFTMTTIPPTTYIPTTSTHTTPTTTEKPEITSCSLAPDLTVTSSVASVYGTTIEFATTLTNGNSHCACNDNQNIPPSTSTATDGLEFVFCQKETGSPTVMVGTQMPGPTCSPAPTINVPFRMGTCTLNMTEEVGTGDRTGKGPQVDQVLYRLEYQAWDGTELPPNVATRYMYSPWSKFTETTTLGRCDTGFPLDIVLDFYIQGPVKTDPIARSLNITASDTGNSTNATNTHMLDLLHREFVHWGLNFVTGDLQWETTGTPKEERLLPYCSLGTWDGLDKCCAKDFTLRRKIDCHWEC